ncbi:hypothetical protein [Planctomicrobium sp. SH527]|uniref:hypothetical protein n=1 Tax=Planctomicrobium sp. SH527 TaxID=3448123 RepID=UPI003F5C37AF
MNRRVLRGATSSILGLCLLIFSGCSRGPDGPAIVPVKGVVIYKDKPLEGGQITFIPDRDKGTTGPMAMGAINGNGEFTLRTTNPDDGAIVGAHKVVISYYKSTPFDPNNPAPPLKDISLVPAIYADEKTTTLTADVTTNKDDNVYKFELK